jgi:lysine 2,3-aminomutase
MEKSGPETYEKLRWRDMAAIRILDYLDNSGREFTNPYRGGEKTVIDPFNLIWLGARNGTGGAKPLFFEDMIQLFRQLTGQLPQQSDLNVKLLSGGCSDGDTDWNRISSVSVMRTGRE